MCRQFEPDRGSQKKTNTRLVFFVVSVNLGENCFSSENPIFFVAMPQALTGGSQKRQEGNSVTAFLRPSTVRKPTSVLYAKRVSSVTLAKMNSYVDRVYGARYAVANAPCAPDRATKITRWIFVQRAFVLRGV